jgi:predicted protein tyrosine phosphatase
MRVDVYNRVQACELEPVEGTAVISISAPADDAPLKHGWDPLLRIEFHDVVIPRAEMPVLVDPNCGRIVMFDEQMAYKIDKFIWANKNGNFMIHCNAGQSRSVAVGMFIKDLFGDTELVLHAVKTTAGANSLVHRLLLQRYWKEQFE